MKPETRRLLEEMSKTPYGRAVNEYLEYHLAEIKDITQTKTWEETLGRQFAAKVVEDLFKIMVVRTPGPGKPKYD